MKPVLGIAPYYIVAEIRIKNLAQTILRQFEQGKPDLKQIKRWAKEIELQCEVIDRLND